MTEERMDLLIRAALGEVTLVARDLDADERDFYHLLVRLTQLAGEVASSAPSAHWDELALAQALEGERPDAARLTHLRDCPQCAGRFFRAWQEMHLITALGGVETPAGLRQSAERLVPTTGPKVIPFRRERIAWWQRPAMKGLAVAALLIVGFFSLYRQFLPPTKEGQVDGVRMEMKSVPPEPHMMPPSPVVQREDKSSVVAQDGPPAPREEITLAEGGGMRNAPKGMALIDAKPSPAPTVMLPAREQAAGGMVAADNSGERTYANRPDSASVKSEVQQKKDSKLISQEGDTKGKRAELSMPSPVGSTQWTDVVVPREYRVTGLDWAQLERGRQRPTAALLDSLKRLIADRVPDAKGFRILRLDTLIQTLVAQEDLQRGLKGGTEEEKVDAHPSARARGATPGVKEAFLIRFDPDGTLRYRLLSK